MIKTTIAFTAGLQERDKYDTVRCIEAWLTDSFGAAKLPNKRRAWSVTAQFYAGSVQVFTRKPEQATLVALRWL